MRLLSKGILVLLLILAGAGCTKDSAESQLRLARESLAKKDTAAALIHLRTALQHDAESAEARFLHGKTLLAAGQPGNATVELRKALALDYPQEEVGPLLAKALLEQRKFKDVTDLGFANPSEPASLADLKTSVATAFMLQGLLPQAEAALQEALQAQPAFATAQVAMASLLARRGELNAAFDQIAKTIEQHPSDSHARKVQGDLLLLVKNDLTGAFDAYRKAIELDKFNLDAHVGAIAILVRRSDPASIEKQLGELRSFAPNHPQTRYFDAQLAVRRGDYPRARVILQDLIRLAPDDVRVLQLAGLAELEAGALAQAETLLLRAMGVTGEQPMTRQLLARTYLRSGQGTKALEVLAPVMAREDPVTLSLAAEAHLLNNAPKRAQELFARVAKLDPKDTRSRTALALAAIGRGDSVGGFQALENMVESDTGTTAALALISAHLARREYPAALKAVDALEKKLTKKALAENLRGRVQVLAGDAKSARASFERALSLDPDFLPAVGSLASLDLAEKKPDDARRRYETLLRKDPKNVQALLALADLNVRTAASVEDVAKLIGRAVKANPAEPAPHLKLVEHYLRSQQPALALTAAQEGVAAVPNHPDLLDALGRAQLASGEGNQAVKTFNTLITLTPHAPGPQLRLAEAQLQAKKVDGARQALKAALLTKPDLLEAQRSLVRLELAAGRPQDALAIARTVQKQRPKEAIGFVLEGDVEDARKSPAAAVAAYRKALQIHPTPEAAVRLHVALVTGGKQAEADKHAAEWMKAHPRDALFLMNLGNLAFGKRDFRQAETHFEEVLKLTPNHPHALSSLAWAMAVQNKPGALAHAEKAAKFSPNDAGLMGTLVFALMQEGQFDRAIEAQKKIVSMHPQAPQYRLNLARLYAKAGKKGPAKAELDELRTLGAAFKEQAEVTRLLKEVTGT